MSLISAFLLERFTSGYFSYTVVRTCFIVIDSRSALPMMSFNTFFSSLLLGSPPSENSSYLNWINIYRFSKNVGLKASFPPFPKTIKCANNCLKRLIIVSVQIIWEEYKTLPQKQQNRPTCEIIFTAKRPLKALLYLQKRILPIAIHVN